MRQCIGDYEALRAFQGLVFGASERFVADVDPATLNDVLLAPPYGSTIAHAFSARVGGDAGVTRSDAREC